MKSWKSWFQPHILARGQSYFAEGRVSALERTDDGCTAIVDGSEEYEVEILLDGSSIDDMICSCPYAEDGNYCKHMAAVLFAMDADGLPAKDAAAKTKRLTPDDLVAKIPDGQLRPLLAELVSADVRLYSALLLQYGDTALDECMKALKNELNAIVKQYSGRDGYIDYSSAEQFSEEIADHIRRQTATLLARGEALLAFRAGVDVLREYAGCDIDNSNGDYILVLDAMDELCSAVLGAAEESVVSTIFDLLADCIQSDQEDWFVHEFATHTMFSRFAGKDYDERKLALVDRQIAALEGSGKSGSAQYELEILLRRRFELMQSLSLPKDEIDAFLEQYTSCPAIRKLRVQRLLDEGKTDDAIGLLVQGKLEAQEQRSLLAAYSEWLIDLYEQLGQQDKLLAELEYHIFTLSFGDMEMLNRLKKACTPEQWIAYRERYLSRPRRQSLELMEAEGLWERLVQAVTASQYLPILDRYENSLKERYPDQMLEAYVRILTQRAAPVSNRTQYQELARYLKKLTGYPRGEIRAAQLAEEWRSQYSRRRAMMEELRNAGF